MGQSNQLHSYNLADSRRDFDGRKCNSRQKWNNGKCERKCNKPVKHRSCEENYAWNPCTCGCQCNEDCEI